MEGLDLKLARVRAGLTLWQLGRLAGVHPVGISETDRGQPSITEAVVEALKEVSDAVFNLKMVRGHRRMKYIVASKGALPQDLAQKIAEAHAKAIKPGNHSKAGQGPTSGEAGEGST